MFCIFYLNLVFVQFIFFFGILSGGPIGILQTGQFPFSFPYFYFGLTRISNELIVHQIKADKCVDPVSKQLEDKKLTNHMYM